MHNLIEIVLLGSCALVTLWFVVFRRQYRMLLTLGLLLSVMLYAVQTGRFAAGLTDSKAVAAAQTMMFAGFALQYVFFFLQLRDFSRKSVAEYEARRFRELA